MRLDSVPTSDHPRHAQRASGIAAVLLVVLAAGPNLASAATWTKIADEWRSFTVSGTKLVRYGAGSTWIEKTVSNSGQCTNNFFGRDPLPGVTKQCQVSVEDTPPVVTTPPPATSTPPPTAAPTVTWTKIADEWRSFTVTGTQLVRYGSGSAWIEKTVSNNGQCTNSFFGGDPMPRVTKQCQVASQSFPPVTAPTVASFTASPGTVTAGGSVTLNWSTNNATSLSIDNGIGSVTGTSLVVTPVQTTTYTLTATNSAGTATLGTTITVNPVAQPPNPGTAARAVPNNTQPTSWSFCSDVSSGPGCQFDGLRQVRIGTGDKWLVKKVMHRLYGHECSHSFFGGNPAPGQRQRCEVADQREEGTIAAPVGCYNDPTKCTVVDLTRIPLGSQGYSDMRVRFEGAETHGQGIGGGSFRTTCEYSHMSFDDPIVFPGQPGRSHLHVFFGNVGADAFSTVESIAGSGNSTCTGGIANRTAYWIPALIDTRTGAPIVPDFTIWYYKTFTVPAYPISANQPLPSGLRMIAGDMHAMAPQRAIDWGCHGRGGANDDIIPTNCNVGEYVELRVFFPSCWDGKNLDSTDHKSHMSYSRGAEGCPQSHPVPVPEISLNVRYLVKNTEDPKHWRLSSDHPGQPSGRSGHADWFDGWIPEVRDAWVRNCSQRETDCGTDNLGDGRKLY